MILLKASVAPMKVRDAKVFVETVGSDNPYASIQILADLGHVHICREHTWSL